MPTDVYLYDAVRTPFGKYGGALAGVRPDDLAAHVLRQPGGRGVSVPQHTAESGADLRG